MSLQTIRSIRLVKGLLDFSIPTEGLRAQLVVQNPRFTQRSRKTSTHEPHSRNLQSCERIQIITVWWLHSREPICFHQLDAVLPFPFWIPNAAPPFFEKGKWDVHSYWTWLIHMIPFHNLILRICFNEVIDLPLFWLSWYFVGLPKVVKTGQHPLPTIPTTSGVMQGSVLDHSFFSHASEWDRFLSSNKISSLFSKVLSIHSADIFLPTQTLRVTRTLSVNGAASGRCNCRPQK